VRKAGAILTLAVVAAILWALWPGAASIPARADDQPGAAAAASDPVPADPALNPGGMPWERPLPDRPPIPRKLVIPADISKQTDEQAQAKSKGCLSSGCHAGIEDMHPQGLPIGCVDCHGGNAAATTKEAAHVHPLYARDWPQSGAMPVRSYAMLNDESPAFVRFVNPGDLRAARMSCGSLGCHVDEVEKVRKSMMATGALLWEAALYNNGVYPEKTGRFGEAYTEDGRPARVLTLPPPTLEDTIKHGILPFLDPLPRFEISQPGNVLRVFERGEDRLSNRGLGTKVRTDPVFLSLNKTRLFDPMLWFLGTNDHPGDYRSSGCTGCHVIYANDRDPVHSGQWAKYGNEGMSASADKSIPHDESGFPVRHQFTNSIPSSQCVVCHVHPGTNVLNSYYGTIWWDNETDGKYFYPPHDKHPSADQLSEAQMANPEGSSWRGLWSDPKFLQASSELNPKLKHVQIADFHGHGWIFRYVYKRDRHGNLLDARGKVVPDDADDKWTRAVKLQDIHLDKGMQCADCHFERDSHGNGMLYGEVRNAISIRCEDCHGTFNKRATFKATGNAGVVDGKQISLKTDSDSKKTDFGSRFLVSSSAIRQQSSMGRVKWAVTQLIDVDNPHSSKYKKAYDLAAYAHTVQKDGQSWGKLGVSESQLAHPNSDMACQTCHSSWVPSCFGCHLPMKANMRKPILRYDGDMTRNWTSYNFQTLRDDVFMMARDGSVTGNRISPARSSCAVLVSSYNADRDVIYTQQQPVSAPGFSAEAFSTTVPHTVRTTETKHCTDCHISNNNDNNAIMAQLLMLGTGFTNFIGRFAWVGEGDKGVDAVVVTERDEPQAVYGSTLHKLAYPDEYARFQARGQTLKESYHHEAEDCRSIWMRGEYLYTADGADGFNVYDIANIDNKDFSERFNTAPVSPLGQRTYVHTKYATAVALPSTLLIDPTRIAHPENQEQKVPSFYAYAFVTDKYEGLITVNVITLGNGNPEDNFFKRGATFNPNGILDGAVNIAIAGKYAYIACDRGIVVVDISDPLNPQLVSEIDAPHVIKPRAIAIQFRYAFVADSEGLKVIDITFPDHPKAVDGAALPIADARNLYVARTYAYISGGAQGLMIVDIERPEHPRLDQIYNAGGTINDLNDTKLGMTNESLFAYLADGRNGMRIVQLTSEDTPGEFGFSPRPTPMLIATYKTHGPALALSRGLDRDRAVDESGNQLSVFGRIGARPFTLPEMQKLYLRNGEVYTVTDTPPPLENHHPTERASR
jgi:hypothetical protein